MDNDISVVPFKFKYLPLLLQMHEDQNYKSVGLINMKSLPKIGYIALLGKQPIAAGFLRKVEGKYAQIDTLVSNPFFGSQIRHKGIELVVDSLLDDAKTLKLNGVIAFTSDISILNRAKAIGFDNLNQVVIGLNLLK